MTELIPYERNDTRAQIGTNVFVHIAIAIGKAECLRHLYTL